MGCWSGRDLTGASRYSGARARPEGCQTGGTPRHRSAPPDLPEIELIGLDPHDVAGPDAAVVLRSSGEQLAVRWRRLQQRYAVVIGANRGCVVRRNSRVHCRVEAPCDEVVAGLHRLEPIRVPGATLHRRGRELEDDPVEHMHLVAAQLHLPWAWPDLPVWLTAVPYTAGVTILGLQLRSRARLRYPSRYFHAAHVVLAAVRDELVTAAPATTSAA